MIRTIIFDIGNVLMHFDFMPYIRDLLKEEFLVEKVIGAIFRTGYWDQMDRGETAEKMYPLMLAAEPEYQEEIRMTFEGVGQCFHRADYAIPWIQELKSIGLRVLYLSNYSEYDMQVSPEVLDFLPFMDGGVFSCYAHALKPEHEIYRKICDDYGLKPQECIFIDDRPENVQAAEEFGMKGLLFTSYAETKKELDDLVMEEKRKRF